MKLSRFNEWKVVFAYNYGHLSLWRQAWMLIKMLTVVRRPRRRSEWFLRMMRCCHCPMYLPALKACGGCGCYMPYKALIAEHGYLWDVEHEKKETFCW